MEIGMIGLGRMGSNMVRELDDTAKRFPPRHYVLVDDKQRILSAVKKAWGNRVTTVFPRQGHYAHDPEVLAAYPPADIATDRIEDLQDHDLPALLAAGAAANSAGPREKA